MSGRLTHAQALALLRERRQARGLSPRTIALEQRALARFLPRLRAPLARLTRPDVERLIAARVAEAGPRAARHDLGALRLLVRLLVGEGLLQVDPTCALRVARGPLRRLVLPEAAVARLLAEASRPGARRRATELGAALALRDRAAVELLYGLGLRAGEAARLRLVDLDLAGRGLVVVRVKGRGGAARLPVPEALVPHLEAYLARGRPALVRARDRSDGRLLVGVRGRALGAAPLGKIVAQIGRRAGVDVHPHALRRSVATHLVRRGATLSAVQHLLGHVGLETTQLYVALDLDALRAGVEPLERVSAGAARSGLPVPAALAPRTATPSDVARSPAAPSAARQDAGAGQ